MSCLHWKKRAGADEDHRLPWQRRRIYGGAADIDLIVRSGSTARIQEAQKFLLHVLCEMVESALAGE
jgi:hypothetical protein